MARIVIADTTSHYDGRDLALRPLGGTETSVIQLAEALARRGHDVTGLTNTKDSVVHGGVRWMPLGAGDFVDCDLFVAVQHPELLGLVRRPRRLALWVVWPPGGFRRRHRAARLWWYRPRPVFVSDFQARAYPSWLPGSRPPLVIPFGLPDAVRGRAPLPAPRRRARSSPPIRSATCAGCSGSGRARSCRPFRGPSSTSTGFATTPTATATHGRRRRAGSASSSLTAFRPRRAPRSDRTRLSRETSSGRRCAGPASCSMAGTGSRPSASPWPKRRPLACRPWCGRSPSCRSACGMASPGSPRPTTTPSPATRSPC